MRNVLQSEFPVSVLSPEHEVVVRKANMADIPALLRLINGYAAKGTMLPRTEFEMSENIRDFSVLAVDDDIGAVGALHFYSPQTAEVRSLAVDPDAKSRGLGRQMVEALEDEARAFDLHSVFAFTYVEGFFAKLGYEQVERGELPLKAWKDCLRCPKFQSCDEIAVVKYLRPDAQRGMDHDPVDLASLRFPIFKQ
jgi:amino-acid N-acetyltransferase